MCKVLSLIVPVFNMSDYLRQCLDSVALPDLEDDFEVIVVNDGSTDNSLNIIKEYAFKYPRLIKVVDKQNGGYGSCFNTGIKIAEGKYFKMLDSDDWIISSALSSYIQMLKHRGDDVIVSGVLEIEDGKSRGESNLKTFPYSAGSSINLNDSRYFLMFIHNFAFRTSVMKSCICPEKTLYTDTIITLHGLVNAHSAFCFGKDLYCYRIGRIGQSVDKAVSARHLNDYLEVANLAYAKYSDLNCSMIAKGLCAYQLERISYFCLQGICSKPISVSDYLEYKKIHDRMMYYCKQYGYKPFGKTMRLSAVIPFFYWVFHFRLKSRC